MKFKELSEAKDPIKELASESIAAGRALSSLSGAIVNKELPDDPNHPVVAKRLAWMIKFNKMIKQADKEHHNLFFKQRAW